MSHFCQIDEGRAELPLTAEKQDTFPIGLALETGSTHQITIGNYHIVSILLFEAKNSFKFLGENQIPVMPMLHILSTHGLLLSFNLLNFHPNRVDICSPPQLIHDKSAVHQFKMSPIGNNQPVTPTKTPFNQQNSVTLLNTPVASDLQVHNNNLTFIPETGATSTPAKPLQSNDFPKPSFGASLQKLSDAPSSLQKIADVPNWASNTQSTAMGKTGN